MKRNKKPILFAVGVIVLVVLVLGGIKASQIGAMIAAGEAFVPPPQAVKETASGTIKANA